MNHDDTIALTQAVARTSAQLELLLWAAGAICGSLIALGSWIVVQQIGIKVRHAELNAELGKLSAQGDSLQSEVAVLRVEVRQVWHHVDHLHRVCGSEINPAIRMLGVKDGSG